MSVFSAKMSGNIFNFRLKIQKIENYMYSLIYLLIIIASYFRFFVLVLTKVIRGQISFTDIEKKKL